MKRLLLCLFAASALISGCTTVETSSEPASKAVKEDYVTGSRLPRSENRENYQGVKGIDRKDYEQYKAPTAIQPGS